MALGTFLSHIQSCYLYNNLTCYRIFHTRMYITLRTAYKTTFFHLHVPNHFCCSPLVCLSDRSTHKFMNEAIWKSTLLLSSLNLILALKYLWYKVWQYMIMEYNSCYITMLPTTEKSVHTSYEASDKCETPTLTLHPVWSIVKHEKYICKPQWLMEQTILAILLYNIIFFVINVLKWVNWLILLAYFSLMNHLLIDKCLKGTILWQKNYMHLEIWNWKGNSSCFLMWKCGGRTAGCQKLSNIFWLTADSVGN